MTEETKKPRSSAQTRSAVYAAEFAKLRSLLLKVDRMKTDLQSLSQYAPKHHSGIVLTSVIYLDLAKISTQIHQHARTLQAEYDAGEEFSSNYVELTKGA